MIFNLAGVVASLATENVTVSTYPRDTFDSHGRAYARSGPTVRTTGMSVQPISGSDLKHLPEGSLSSEFVALWSTITLANRDQVQASRGLFEVFHVDPWEGSGAYCKALARLMATGENP